MNNQVHVSLQNYIIIIIIIIIHNVKKLCRFI